MKLLTPGPLTTTASVKEVMLEDRCTWDDLYKEMTVEINERLLALAGLERPDYDVVLMQGSGSFVVESVLTSSVGPEDRILIITNGAYGKRMVEMAKRLGLDFEEVSFRYDQEPSADYIASLLMKNQHITHIAMVHCETTTGMENPIQGIGQLAKRFGKTFIVDAMSSFGGIPIDFELAHIDFLVSSANKCIHGVPGFGFVIARTEALAKCEGLARSVALDLYDQWTTMRVDGKWRFTSPTHVVAAFLQALKELEAAGGIQKRHGHYVLLNQYLRKEMKQLGFQTYIDDANQSPIITTFYYPTADFSFTAFYERLKERGFILYPGKLTNISTFRIGNIGHLHLDDIKELVHHIETYMDELLYLEELACIQNV